MLRLLGLEILLNLSLRLENSEKLHDMEVLLLALQFKLITDDIFLIERDFISYSGRCAPTAHPLN
jgi:hypothetical protein